MDNEKRSIMIFDSTDKKLLEFLQQDSKQTNKELSNKLGLSVTAVFERIKKLEKEGFIDGYVAVVNKKRIDRDFVVFCHVKLVQHSQEFVVRFEREVKKLNEVLECYHLSGDYDYLLKVIVKDMPEFRAFMVKKLTTINHIGSTHSMFVINEVKQTSVINF
jgi:Lrp/AsnC family leucine-responsive transcriptional regulator